MGVDPDIVAYYNQGAERARLTEAPSLELVRTQVLLARFLSAPPARVLDVGGAAGVYASWLAGLRALTEARRVVRAGGVVVATVISRYASVLDGFFLKFIDGKPGFSATAVDTLRSGIHRNPRRDPGLFTTSYFHTRDDLAAEIADAGLQLEAIMPVQGPLQWAPGIKERLADPAQRELILDVLAVLEQDPAVTGLSAHLLAVAHRTT